MAFGAAFCEDVPAPYELSVTTPTVAAVLCIITVPGNLLICWAIMKDPNNELKTSFNYLVLNLAIADLITGIITEPYFVFFHAREAMNNDARNLEIVHVTYFISCTASVVSIGALATERYLTVTSPRRRSFSRPRAIAVSVAIWSFSITISCFYFVTNFYTFLFVFVHTTVISTLAIISFAYIRIYQSLHAHVARAQITQADRIVEESLRCEKKATRTFFLVLLFFVCCNLSSFVMVYVINFCDVCSCEGIHWLRDFQFLVALVNCAANQFLYAWRMPAFTRAFKLSMRIIWRVGSVKRRRVRSDEMSSATAKSTGIESISTNKVKCSSV